MDFKDSENLAPKKETVTLEDVVSREIVQEILKFGVTQSQILKIIEVLALELENRNTMISIVECINKDHEMESGLITDI